jgi:hypothetical protein
MSIVSNVLDRSSAESRSRDGISWTVPRLKSRIWTYSHDHDHEELSVPVFSLVSRTRKQFFWIQIYMFLDLLDPNPSLFARIRIRVLLSSSKNSKKNLDFHYFVTTFMTVYL